MNISLVCAHDPTEAVKARASGELYVIEVETAGCTVSVLLSRAQADSLQFHLETLILDQCRVQAERLEDRDPTQPFESPR